MSMTSHSAFFPQDALNERRRAYELVKRGLDIIAALIALAPFAPVWLIIALLIRLTSPGPALYRQPRVVGKNGREFTVYKFRTMVQGASNQAHREAIARFVSGHSLATEKKGGDEQTIYKLTADPRITPLGRYLRKTGLDEIPQFLNVLRGEMSVVGPRPPIYYEYEHYSEHQRRRLSVRPGITGLYQVTARSRVTFEKMVEIDLEYIARRSLWLDLWIMWKTPWTMLTGRGAY